MINLNNLHYYVGAVSDRHPIQQLAMTGHQVRAYTVKYR